MGKPFLQSAVILQLWKKVLACLCPESICGFQTHESPPAGVLLWPSITIPFPGSSYPHMSPGPGGSWPS